MRTLSHTPRRASNRSLRSTRDARTGRLLVVMIAAAVMANLLSTVRAAPVSWTAPPAWTAPEPLPATLDPREHDDAAAVLSRLLEAAEGETAGIGVPVLTRVLATHPRPRVRCLAAVALAGEAAPRARRALERARTDVDAVVQGAARAALAVPAKPAAHTR